MSASPRVDANRLIDLSAAVYASAGIPEDTLADLTRIAKEAGPESKLPF